MSSLQASTALRRQKYTTATFDVAMALRFAQRFERAIRRDMIPSFLYRLVRASWKLKCERGGEELSFEKYQDWKLGEPIVKNSFQKANSILFGSIGSLIVLDHYS